VSRRTCSRGAQWVDQTRKYGFSIDLGNE